MKHMSMKEYSAVTIGLGLIALIFFVGNGPSLFRFGDVSSSNTTSMTDTQTNTENAGGAVPEPKELQITDVVIGTGAEALAKSSVEVNYVLTLANGQKIDSSYDRGDPLPFSLGTNPPQVIPGFERGVLGMKVGGKRHIIIPSFLGYGDRQVGPIPPSSTLIFDVELVSVK
jgi:FKBP-type peptidyl-prolyl cis-trans isomerase